MLIGMIFVWTYVAHVVQGYRSSSNSNSNYSSSSIRGDKRREIEHQMLNTTSTAVATTTTYYYYYYYYLLLLLLLPPLTPPPPLLPLLLYYYYYCYNYDYYCYYYYYNYTTTTITTTTSTTNTTTTTTTTSTTTAATTSTTTTTTTTTTITLLLLLFDGLYCYCPFQPILDIVKALNLRIRPWFSTYSKVLAVQVSTLPYPLISYWMVVASSNIKGIVDGNIVKCRDATFPALARIQAFSFQKRNFQSFFLLPNMICQCIILYLSSLHSVQP